MKCIKSEEIYYYDDKLHKYFFKYPYNNRDYFFITYFHKLNLIHLVYDLEEVDYLLSNFFEFPIYIINKCNFTIAQII